jgi:hypothetical protein
VKRTKAKDQTQVLMSIHRHWIWAERIREEYFEVLNADPPTDSDWVAFFLTGHGMYLSIWFGLEFAVWEDLQSRGFVVPGADKEMRELSKSLKDFRHAIFHIQPDLLSEKWELLNKPGHQTKINKAHKEIGEWLSAQLGI